MQQKYLWKDLQNSYVVRDQICGHRPNQHKLETITLHPIKKEEKPIHIYANYI